MTEDTPSPATDGGLDRDAVARLRELQPDAGPDVLDEIFGLFLQDTPPRLETLRQAVGRGDATLLERAAHGLKSSSAMVGARRMATLCGELESAGAARTLDGTAALLAELEQEFERVRPWLRSERWTD